MRQRLRSAQNYSGKNRTVYNQTTTLKHHNPVIVTSDAQLETAPSNHTRHPSTTKNTAVRNKTTSGFFSPQRNVKTNNLFNTQQRIDINASRDKSLDYPNDITVTIKSPTRATYTMMNSIASPKVNYNQDSLKQVEKYVNQPNINISKQKNQPNFYQPYYGDSNKNLKQNTFSNNKLKSIDHDAKTNFSTNSH